MIAGMVVMQLKDCQWPIWFDWTVLATISILFSYIRNDQVPSAIWVVSEKVAGRRQGYIRILNAQNFAMQAVCTSGNEGLVSRHLHVFGLLQFSTA